MDAYREGDKSRRVQMAIGWGTRRVQKQQNAPTHRRQESLTFGFREEKINDWYPGRI